MLKNVITCMIIACNAALVGSQDNKPVSLRARIYIDNCFTDMLKVFIQASLCNAMLYKSEIWKKNNRIYEDFYTLKPMFTHRNNRQIYYVIPIIELSKDNAKVLDDAIQRAWNNAHYDYKHAKTTWGYYDDDSIVLLHEASKSNDD